MRSPVEKSSILVQREIEPGLRVWQCPATDGRWIPLSAYTLWQNLHRHETKPLPADYHPHLVDDSERAALICPESGCIMTRFRVGHGLNFQIDRSPVTGGVWLDSGEWEALKLEGLHTILHLIFTAPYQKKIRTLATDNALANSLWRLIGSKDFDRVSQFREWMTNHDHSAEIFAFLHDAQHAIVPVHPEKEDEDGSPAKGPTAVSD